MIIRFMGGMGNQMFQYAMGRALGYKWNEKVYYDDSSYEDDELRSFVMDSFNVDICKASQIELKKYKHIRMLVYRMRKYVNISRLAGYQREKNYYEYYPYKRAKYFEGYWQNEQFFFTIREELQRELVYTGELTEKQEQIIEQMQHENSVALHVRHGDYLNSKNKDWYVCLPVSYYQKGIEYLETRTDHLKIYVFSDDIDWCKQNFINYNNMIYIDENISDNANVDFELMRHCRHYIIANSTFSWWPAWLASNDDKIVIAPDKWYFDENENQAIRQALLSSEWVIHKVENI